jgi:hypothetical protein
VNLQINFWNVFESSSSTLMSNLHLEVGAGRISWYTRLHSKNAEIGNHLFLEI